MFTLLVVLKIRTILQQDNPVIINTIPIKIPLGKTPVPKEKIIAAIPP
ncbi:hypothetical protein [Candidatus Williamhamiltonella defendens]|nr:hypothetical protein [Candidatus Hamiltonella defensa]